MGRLKSVALAPVLRSRQGGLALPADLRHGCCSMYRSTMRRTSSAIGMPSRLASRIRNFRCGSVNEIICLVISKSHLQSAHQIDPAERTKINRNAHVVRCVGQIPTEEILFRVIRRQSIRRQPQVNVRIIVYTLDAIVCSNIKTLVGTIWDKCNPGFIRHKQGRRLNELVNDGQASRADTFVRYLSDVMRVSVKHTLSLPQGIHGVALAH